jgi:hypothetical protein
MNGRIKFGTTCTGAAALLLSACVAVGNDPPGDAVGQALTDCQEQEMAPEFDLIRSRISMSETGAQPAPFMLESTDRPGPEERIEIARLSEIRDTCYGRYLSSMSVPPPGVSPAMWQQVLQILEQDRQDQHALMMGLIHGQMPYGEFERERTRIAVRMAAAMQPFMQEAAALQQVAELNAEATGAFVDFFIDVLDAVGDAGAVQGGHRYHGGHSRTGHSNVAR